MGEEGSYQFDLSFAILFDVEGIRYIEASIDIFQEQKGLMRSLRSLAVLDGEHNLECLGRAQCNLRRKRLMLDESADCELGSQIGLFMLTSP